MLRKLRLQKSRRYESRHLSPGRRYNHHNAFRWLLIICLQNIPKRRWDQVVMFMFICALFPFLHALFGIGGEQDGTRPVNDTTGESPNKSLEKNIGRVAIHIDQLLATDIRVGDPVGDITQLTNAPTVSVPQDAFPDPTPHSEMISTLPSAATLEQTPRPSAPSRFWFHENKMAERMPYDPFYLDFSSMGPMGAH